MKSILKFLLIALIISLASVARAQSPATAMTNSAVIKLVRAGFKDKTVIAIIHSRPNRFDLDPDRLIELKHNGVSENIILAMLSQSDNLFVEDDLSFPDSNPTNKKSNAESGGNDIFGDRAGTRGETRGRGTSGSNQGDRTTTGSATVRILRPPADEKGAGLKLEKTPTLTNESIIGLVDAGFSEGTIIKRIEDSPVDFDLSDPRVTELRRHRVTEPVIIAMKTATRYESDSNQPKIRSN
ncbi:MAG: hypothetical protein QOF62_1186 [Pyrinomonadaceae bacterium]|jgi:hypothetical protein|nr:hypothetical protein [Pyrinomonadaceae bacterium]